MCLATQNLSYQDDQPQIPTHCFCFLHGVIDVVHHVFCDQCL